jgi:hypothetical protein
MKVPSNAISAFFRQKNRGPVKERAPGLLKKSRKPPPACQNQKKSGFALPREIRGAIFAPEALFPKGY